MRKYIIALMLVTMAHTANADFFDQWTKADTAREATYLALHVIDWGQTRNIVRRIDEDYKELNPLLGNSPSIKRVDTHMAVSAVLHVAAAYALPREWREGFQYATIGYVAAVVVRNNSIGLKVDFK